MRKSEAKAYLINKDFAAYKAGRYYTMHPVLAARLEKIGVMGEKKPVEVEPIVIKKKRGRQKRS
jgi:hypothetical protein